MLWSAFFLLACATVMTAVLDDAEDGDARVGWRSWRAIALGVVSASGVLAFVTPPLGPGLAVCLLAAGGYSAWAEARPRVFPRVERFLARLDAWGRDPVSRILRIQERIDRAEACSGGLSRVGALGVFPLWIGLATSDPVSLFLGGVTLSAPAAGIIRRLSRRAEVRSLMAGLHERLDSGVESKRLENSTAA